MLPSSYIHPQYNVQRVMHHLCQSVYTEAAESASCGCPVNSLVVQIPQRKGLSVGCHAARCFHLVEQMQRVATSVDPAIAGYFLHLTDLSCSLMVLSL